MILHDISKIDLNAIQTVRIPKKLRDIASLYRACDFEEADKRLAEFGKYPHQVSAIKAQLAFFNWDFDSTIEHIMDYFPYLCEWYTGNMKRNTLYMLVFSIINSNSGIGKECLDYLKKAYESFSEDELENNKNYMQFSLIPEIIKAADGNLDPKKKYVPRDNPETFEEIFDGYAGYHKKQLSKLTCPPEDDPRTASDLLLLIYSSGRIDDFIPLYEKHCKSPLISESVHYDAARIFMYLGNYERASQALRDCAEFAWYPIEFTDVKPVSIIDDYDLFPLITKNLLREIYNIPREI